MKSKVILVLLGILIGVLMAPMASAGEEPFLDQVARQRIGGNALGWGMHVTKYVDNQNGNLVYVTTFSESVGIAVIKP